jgi:uncharacterized protein (DUF1684 family)
LTRSRTYLELLDYRRRVRDLYAEVRAMATSDPPAAHARWREERDRLFRSHPQSALAEDGRAAFAGLRYFPYDVRYRFAAPIRSEESSEPFPVETRDGAALVMRRVGVLELPVGRLAAYWIDVYGGGLFVPFRDGTSGNETYGGGRYLLDTVKSADLGSTTTGELVLDFNFAFHPSCTYDYRWSCPLAPRDNWLAARIEAGERL